MMVGEHVFGAVGHMVKRQSRIGHGRPPPLSELHRAYLTSENRLDASSSARSTASSPLTSKSTVYGSVVGDGLGAACEPNRPKRSKAEAKRAGPQTAPTKTTHPNSPTFALVPRTPESSPRVCRREARRMPPFPIG